jgi:hypothetical protein
MAELRVRILGLEEAEALLATLSAGARAAGRTVVRVGTATVYAWGIVFGQTRSGRLARRAGGTFSLPDAFEAVRPEVAPALATALPDGEGAVVAAMLRLGYRVEAGTKAREAVRTGNLRRSYHTVKGPR